MFHFSADSQPNNYFKTSTVFYHKNGLFCVNQPAAPSFPPSLPPSTRFQSTSVIQTGLECVRQGITLVRQVVESYIDCGMCVCFFLARVLLVDYSPPFDADTCEYLHDALVNFFSLVNHLSGPCRTPFFGLFALIDHPEVSLWYVLI